MNSRDSEEKWPGLDDEANEKNRLEALKRRCQEYRDRLKLRDPNEVARLAALQIIPGDEKVILCGEHWELLYKVAWPNLEVTLNDGGAVSLQTEALWLHYMDRADGQPLMGRWVNLSEIGGLFYQQAFQGYTGDLLAKTFGDEIGELEKICRANKGWQIRGLGELAFQWQALPRVPVCVCYRRPKGSSPSWATILFDASASHYLKADVAAFIGSQLTKRLMEGKGGKNEKN